MIDLARLHRSAELAAERADEHGWIHESCVASDARAHAVNVFIGECEPGVVLGLIRQLDVLVNELGYAATVCETSGYATASVKHWRELIRRVTTARQPLGILPGGPFEQER